MPETRIPPQDDTAEMCALGSVIVDRDHIVTSQVLSQLQATDFFTPAHRPIFEALHHLFENNTPIDLVILRDELEQRKALRKVGGVDYLLALAESVPSEVNGGYYANIVHELAVTRKVIAECADVGQHAYSGERGVKLIERLQTATYKLADTSGAKAAVHIRDIIPGVIDDILSRSKDVLPGMATGFREFDELTGGFQPGEFIVVAGRPSMGKTAWAFNVIEHVAMNLGKPVLAFTLEMSTEALTERILASVSSVSTHSTRCGFQKSLDDQQRLKDAGGAISDSPIILDDSYGLTLLDAHAKARAAVHRHGIELVVIDYLQLMRAPGAPNRREEVGIISRGLKGLARELGIPVICVAQLNRGPDSRDGHRPLMSDLKESGDVEQDADKVLLLYREDYYEEPKYHLRPDWNPTNTGELIIAKNRNGPTGSVAMCWDRDLTKFKNLAPENAGMFE